MSVNQDEKDTYPIVVGTDYSELGDLAIERAFQLSKAQAGTHVHVVHVDTAASVTPDPHSEAVSNEFARASIALRDHVERLLKRWCDTHSSPPAFARLTTHIRTGSAAQAIAQLASDVEAELVVVGTNGRQGARRLFLGSVAEATVRLAPCAVLVVRGRDAVLLQQKIEPPCPHCIETRRATQGVEVWCEQHREHHVRRHTYHYATDAGSHQSGFLIH